MKKILIAFDGVNFSKGAFEFVRALNHESPVFVTGVFLPQVDYANVRGYGVGAGDHVFIPLVENSNARLIEENIQTFGTLCEENRIEYAVHKDFYDLAMPQLKKETRFADLLVLGSESFYANFGVTEPNDSLKDAIHRAECPLLIVPENFRMPECNILTYDGTDSSVYALKQFACLFSAWSNNETMLVHVRKGGESTIPDEEYIQELASRHFPDLTIVKLPSDARKYFNTWVEQQKPSIVVSGAFGRSGFSQLFKKSFISEVIRDHKMPVFIAHP
jgi:nucleotide-binding universal stress UspA family protein